jgi:predicted porin
MKKALLAVVALAATGSVFAQSSVSIYGRVNITAENQKSGSASRQVLADNASRWGLKGTEDLGGGLKASFVLESGFDASTGRAQASFFGRQSEVNLAGGFGMVRLGNFTSEAYFATSDFIGMHNHETGTSSDAFYAYVGRNTNKIAYRTPEFVKGLTAEAAVSAPEGAVGAKRTVDLAANYAMGPLALGFGYENANVTGLDVNQFAVRALYNTGPITVGATVQRDENGFGPFGTRTNFRVAAMYEMGPSEFHLNIGRAGKYSKLANSEATQLTLGVNYNLSKRTKAYGYYTRLDNSAASPYALGFAFGAAGQDQSTFAVGVRHNF